MKHLLVILIAGVLFGCTTVQSRSSASANLKDVTYSQAFRVATQAALEAGFTWNGQQGCRIDYCN
jgi:hypothetical protein